MLHVGATFGLHRQFLFNPWITFYAVWLCGANNQVCTMVCVSAAVNQRLFVRSAAAEFFCWASPEVLYLCWDAQVD